MSKKESEEEEETTIVNDESEGTEHEDATAARTANDSYTVDLRKIRLTELPTNRRVIISDQQGVQLEQHLQHLKARIEQVTEAYLETVCDDRGEVKEEILSKEERKGSNR